MSNTEPVRFEGDGGEVFEVSLLGGALQIQTLSYPWDLSVVPQSSSRVLIKAQR